MLFYSIKIANQQIYRFYVLMYRWMFMRNQRCRLMKPISSDYPHVRLCCLLWLRHRLTLCRLIHGVLLLLSSRQMPLNLIIVISTFGSTEAYAIHFSYLAMLIGVVPIAAEPNGTLPKFIPCGILSTLTLRRLFSYYSHSRPICSFWNLKPVKMFEK